MEVKIANGFVEYVQPRHRQQEAGHNHIHAKDNADYFPPPAAHLSIENFGKSNCLMCNNEMIVVIGQRLAYVLIRNIIALLQND